MGIFGLSGIVNKKNFKYSSAINKNDKIDIVIDGDNIMHSLMSFFPLEYDMCDSAVSRLIEYFFYKLEKYKMNPVYCIFDSMVKNQKQNTKVVRKEQDINNIIIDYQEMNESGSFMHMDLYAIPIFMDCLTSYIKENNINCRVIRIVGHGDLEIAHYAKENNCYVLTNDSDFFLYDIKGLILFSELDGFSSTGINMSMLFNDRYVYSPETVSKSLNLPIEYFPLFGALAGFTSSLLNIDDTQIHIKDLIQIINKNKGDIQKIIKELYNITNKETATSVAKQITNKIKIHNTKTIPEYPLDLYVGDTKNISKTKFRRKLSRFMSIENIAKIIMDYQDYNNNLPFLLLFNSQGVITPRLPTEDAIKKLSHFCFDLQRLSDDKFYYNITLYFYGDTRFYFNYLYLGYIYVVPARGDHMDFFESFRILLDFINNKNDQDILKDLCDIYNVTNIYENIDIHGNFPILLPLSLILYCRYNIRYDKKILHSLAYAHYMKHTHVRRLNSSYINDNIDLLAIKDEYFVIYSTLNSICCSLGHIYNKVEPLCFSAFLYNYLQLSDGSIQFTERENTSSFNNWFRVVMNYIDDNRMKWDYLDLPLSFTLFDENSSKTKEKETETNYSSIYSNKSKADSSHNKSEGSRSSNTKNKGKSDNKCVNKKSINKNRNKNMNSKKIHKYKNIHGMKRYKINNLIKADDDKSFEFDYLDAFMKHNPSFSRLKKIQAENEAY
ncbi:hypothetical protein WA158_005139 [Blastocystis sp. Blastoise]